MARPGTPYAITIHSRFLQEFSSNNIVSQLRAVRQPNNSNACQALSIQTNDYLHQTSAQHGTWDRSRSCSGTGTVRWAGRSSRAPAGSAITTGTRSSTVRSARRTSNSAWRRSSWEDEELRNRPPPPKEPYDPLKSNLAKRLDEYRLPFVVDSVVGILHGARGEKHAGKWTYDENGVVVERVPVFLIPYRSVKMENTTVHRASRFCPASK